MASPNQVRIDPKIRPVFAVDHLTPESATKASQVLQENHEQHHIFFNQDGFHNHIVHHVLAIYALGATPSEIQRAYDGNKGYQRPHEKLETSVVEDMKDPKKFRSMLGGDHEKLYHDFLVFFQDQFQQNGWKNVVNEYLFKGNEASNDLLVRTFGGFLHPLIHLGYGVEFEQPAIIAEALAQAAVHDSEHMIGFYAKVDEKSSVLKSQGQKSKTLVQILDDLEKDDAIKNALQWDDRGSRLRAIVSRQPNRLAEHLSQYFVTPDEIDEKLAEMINATIYFAAAAQHPGKAFKWDFFYIHCVNCSIFFPSFMKQDWMSPKTKARLLEMKARTDLALYVSRRCAHPYLEDVKNYCPRFPSSNDSNPWEPLFKRATALEDDGHLSKLIRAIAAGQKICAPFEEKAHFRIKRDMWLNLGHMAMDSVERSNEQNWVRSAGFSEAWRDIGPRANL